MRVISVSVPADFKAPRARTTSTNVQRLRKTLASMALASIYQDHTGKGFFCIGVIFSNQLF